MKFAPILLLLASLLAARQSYALECLQRYAAAVHEAWQDVANGTDTVETRQTLAPLAEDGYAPAMYTLALSVQHSSAEDEQRSAHKWTRLAAARGYPPAYALLGDWSLAESRRAAADDEPARARYLELEALFWYRLGEVHGEPDALWGVGEIYRHGKIVDPTPTIAFNAALSAVEQGVTSTLDAKQAAAIIDERLARLTTDYLQGNGTAPDNTQAYRWSLLRVSQLGAAATPDDRAMLAELAARVKPQQADEAERLAQSWAPKRPDYSLRAPYAFEPVRLSEAMVRRVQGALVAAGLEPGPVDGVFSAATARAIVEMEALIGVPATAAITHRLLAALQIQEVPTGDQTCADAWLDEQPAFSAFAVDTIPLGEDDAEVDFSELDVEGDSLYDAGGDVDAMLDQVISNNEEMLRHLSINEMVAELQAMPAAIGHVGTTPPTVCSSVGDLVSHRAGAPAGSGCYTLESGTAVRLLWCADRAARICEVEITRSGEPTRGWLYTLELE